MHTSVCVTGRDVFMHSLQDLLQGQEEMETALEHFLEKLSPPSVEALPVTLMLLSHVKQLDKVLCRTYSISVDMYRWMVGWMDR